jgi:hypothetical protein
MHKCTGFCEIHFNNCFPLPEVTFSSGASSSLSDQRIHEKEDVFFAPIILFVRETGIGAGTPPDYS